MIDANKTMLLVMIIALAAVFVVLFGALFLKQRKLQKERQQKTAVIEKPEKLILLPENKVEEDPFLSSKTLKAALVQTEKNFWGRLQSVFGKTTANQDLEELEEVLYTSDLGPQTVQRLLARVEGQSDLGTIKASLRDEFGQIFNNAHVEEPNGSIFSHLKMNQKPAVWMIVGVNGAGKTTTIGKLAAHLAKGGKKVLVAAGDTFRAAAGNQLKTWTVRAEVEIFWPEGVNDPSAVAFDAVSKAKAQNYDVVIIDTAGRLHTQVNLMEELKKVKRVISKVLPDAPHEILIVLDANSGQNALVQAREFNSALGLSGVVLTKMDGTAKGGVAVGLSEELKVPIRLVGIGEKIGDLKAFSSKDFIDSILG